MSLTHHATLYSGTTIADTLPSELRQQTADIVHYVQPDWGIADSRRLAAEAYVKPVVSETRTLIVCTSRLTHEAQNALLKLFEEPPVTTRLILIVPDTGQLLPTLLSRLQRQVQTVESVEEPEWLLFAAADYKTRFEQIADSAKRKDTAWQRRVLLAAISDIAVPPKTRLVLDSYANRSGASRKMLLEEVALTLPIGARA